MKAALVPSVSDISNENEKYGALLNRAFEVSIRRAGINLLCNICSL
jgi:hypothetical protein